MVHEEDPIRIYRNGHELQSVYYGVAGGIGGNNRILNEDVYTLYPSDDVLVIVLEDKVIKFKGYTFSLSGEGGGGGGSIDPKLLEGFIPLSRDFSDDFNDDFAR